MMKFETIGSWKFSCDKAMTQKVYQSIKSGDSKSCICPDCKNYVAYMESGNWVFPEPFMQVLDKLGIDYSKETELNSYGVNKSGFTEYCGYFQFIGKLESEIDWIEYLDGKFKYWLTNHVGAEFIEFSDYSLVQIEFTGLELPLEL